MTYIAIRITHIHTFLENNVIKFLHIKYPVHAYVHCIISGYIYST